MKIKNAEALTRGNKGRADCLAIVEAGTLDRADKMGLSIADALKENASYDFLKRWATSSIPGPRAPT